MAHPPFTDPFAWRALKAPSLAGVRSYRAGGFPRGCRENSRICAKASSIQVDDFPTDEVLDEMGAETEFDLLGLFQGIGLPFRSDSAPVQMPNMIWLYRRPILDYWAEHEETLGAIITHVLVHEIGHHFGLSDEDMEAIEASVVSATARTSARSRSRPAGGGPVLLGIKRAVCFYRDR